MVDSLGHFRLLEQIGTGGLGEVFRARDTKVGRTVAVKVVPSSIADDGEARAELIADAQRASKVSHPNVATLFEIVDEPEGLSLAIEYVPGETLRHAVGGRPLNARRAVEIATQIADALAEAHAAGVLHLDLSPDTIVLTPKGTAKLLDLGLSAWTSGGRATTARRPPGWPVAIRSIWRPLPICRPSRRWGSRPRSKAISSRSAWCSSRCSPAGCRSAARIRPSRRSA